MPGGPVNGVPWTGMSSLVGGAGIASAARRNTDPNESSNTTGIIVPTVLQMATDALNYWTSMMCLYDRYWEPDPDRVTLPVCMFHVKKIVPARTVEVSKKRVILYEPQQDESITTEEKADQMRHGVMQSIVDNAVKQPVTYSAELIVPFQPIGRYVAEGAKTISDMIAAMSDLFGGGFPISRVFNHDKHIMVVFLDIICRLLNDEAVFLHYSTFSRCFYRMQGGCKRQSRTVPFVQGYSGRNGLRNQGYRGA